MRQPVFALLLLLAQAGALRGQDVPAPVPGHHIKISLADAIDPFSPAFMLGYEHPFSKKISLLVEGGPVSTFDGTWVLRSTMDGYKFRGELRWYNEATSTGDMKHYLGLQAMHKRTVKYKQDIFCRDDCSFFQVLDYSFVNKVTAAHVSFGITGTISKHFVMEIGCYGGVRLSDRDFRGVPEDAVFQGEGAFFNVDTPGRFGTISLGASLRAGFGW